jgi:hypothetical protein
MLYEQVVIDEHNELHFVLHAGIHLPLTGSALRLTDPATN